MKFHSFSSGLSYLVLDCDCYSISECDYSSLNCTVAFCGLWLVALFNKIMIEGIRGIAFVIVSQGHCCTELRLLIK